ncbi:hypothetical protein, partial [Methylobacterium sp. J-076]|uniref:hypothetical protein n=1 Tax=Methylobacterium sp. J-076 TaxID=2836655 RepID=UPI001FBB65A3
MADERLRLVAEVQDQFTGPLDKLNAKLQRTAAAGSQAAKDMRKDFEGFHGSIGKLNTTLGSMSAPFTALGLASGGAALSMGAIGTALRGFSQNTQNLSILSKQS